MGPVEFEFVEDVEANLILCPFLVGKIRLDLNNEELFFLKANLSAGDECEIVLDGDLSVTLCGEPRGEALEAVIPLMDSGSAGGVERASQEMGRAAERMSRRDPSGARHESRAAADTLERTLEGARGAARRAFLVQDVGLVSRTPIPATCLYLLPPFTPCPADASAPLDLYDAVVNPHK